MKKIKYNFRKIGEDDGSSWKVGDVVRWVKPYDKIDKEHYHLISKNNALTLSTIDLEKGGKYAGQYLVRFIECEEYIGFSAKSFVLIKRKDG